MNISTKLRLATVTVFAAIGLIAAAIWLAYVEVEDANRQRQQTTGIARGLTELRLVTFEYALLRHERPRAQWHRVSQRIDRLIADNHFSLAAHKEILAGLREKRANATSIFAEFASAAAAGDGGARSDETNRRFEAQLLGRLLVGQQDSLEDAFRLTDLATGRINVAQQRVLTVIAGGIGLIALIAGGAFWLVRRDVIAPIVKLQQATREIAAGNWSYKPGIGGDDEIGALARNFESMARRLEATFTEIERKNLQLAALNQELEAFSYSVSHDLRAPLRSLDGFSLALIEDYGDKLDEEGKDTLGRIRAACRRMGELIDDLLRLSQVTRTNLKLKRVDLSAMAQAVAESLQGDRTTEWAIEQGMTATADAELMGILMQNLLQNAWKFAGKTQAATIRVGTTQDSDGEKAYFIADNGAGFDMAHAGRLFGAFQRLHRADEFPGTGIGLAIVQRIVRRHGGRIWAEAKPGEGATFFFTVGQAEG